MRVTLEATSEAQFRLCREIYDDMVTDVTDGRLGGSCSDKVTVKFPSISLADSILSALCCVRRNSTVVLLISLTKCCWSTGAKLGGAEPARDDRPPGR